MRMFISAAVGGLAAVLAQTGTVAAKPAGEAHAAHAFPRLSTTDGAPVEMASHPGSPADTIARQLVSHEIKRAKAGGKEAGGKEPVVLVAMARLNDQDEFLFVQLQSPRECGSAGCTIMAFRHVDGQWVRTMDTVGASVRVASSRRNGMPDMIVDGYRLIWDGARYKDVG